MQVDCRAIFGLVHPDDRDDVWDTLVESAKNLTSWKRKYRVNFPRQGNRWRFAHTTVERLSDGGTLWHGFIADVNWRKETELSLFAAGHREVVALRKEKLFAAYFQAEGSGLALSISRKLSELLGGDIAVRSEPRVGF